MPRILKIDEQNILQTKYHFLDISDENDFEEISYKEYKEQQQSDQEIIAEMMLKAKNEALLISQAIIDEANDKAKQIIQSSLEEGYEEGYKKGFSQAEADGYTTGYEEGFVKGEEFVKINYENKLEELSIAIEDVKKYQQTLDEQSKINATRLAITVAEKVIKVSLSASTAVIEKIINETLEESKDDEKVKIFISDFDAKLITKCNKNLLDIIVNKSNNIKVEVMQDAAIGTCIVEFEDKVIDASTNTQLENIKEFITG